MKCSEMSGREEKICLTKADVKLIAYWWTTVALEVGFAPDEEELVSRLRKFIR